MKKKRVIIIGAGFGGLSCAAVLADRGFRVTLIEKNGIPGGRAGYFEKNGFRFDTGPSWYMMPEVFSSFFGQFGKSAQDFYLLKRLNPSYRAFFGKDFVDLSADTEDIFDIFEKREKGSAKELKQILALAKNLYELSLKKFLYRDSDFKGLLNPEMANILIRNGLLGSYDSYIKRKIKDKDLRKLLMWHTVFLGGTPKNVPALYILMLHVDMVIGTYYPAGGMFRVAEAFKDMAKMLGVKFVFSEKVQKIIVKNSKATAVDCSGDLIEGDIVVCNADYNHVETQLLDPEWRSYSDLRWEKRTMSPGTFLCFLGINKKIDGILHHNYFFSEHWDSHFASIAEKNRWPEEYSYYVSCRSKSDRSVAPENSEDIMMLVPVAPGLRDDDETRERFKEVLLDKFEKDLGEKICDSISVSKIHTHRDQIKKYNAYKGNSFGVANTLFGTGPLRPANHSKKVRNLFFTGTGTIPGIGMPLSVISGQVTAEKIIKSYDKNN
ncbi:phytoene desaturase [candidate division WOR-3 bacterium]|nr:phytoene desaturase [candidate division WOR-3 bacterium]